MTDRRRPLLTLLDPDEPPRIVDQAIQLLETKGIFVENDEALRLLDGASQPVDKGRVLLQGDTIKKALSTVPGNITLHDRQGAPAALLGGNNVQFDPGSAALHLLDPKTRRRRAPKTVDCAHFAWIADSCRHLAAQSTGVIPSDVPEGVADRVRLAIALANGTKPVVTGTFQKDAFAVMREMLTAVRGSEEALRDQPLAIFDCCPTPPLKWSDLTCQALIDAARAGIPAELVSMPLTGATSPVSLREAVVQHAAECLSGVLIHQLAVAGSPIIWGGSPSAFDMRHGTTPMGAIGTMMIDSAYAQVGKHLGLPTHAYMGLSDAKSTDWQAGMESGIGAVLAALSGINMVSGAGMLDFESCQSMEKLLLDNESCGMALFLVRGICTDSADRAVELIGAAVDQEQLLGHPHTRRNFRKELFFPGPLIDRATYGDWEARGGLDSFAAAKAEVDRLIAKGNPAPLPEETAREIERIVNGEMERLGHPPLDGTLFHS